MTDGYVTRRALRRTLRNGARKLPAVPGLPPNPGLEFQIVIQGVPVTVQTDPLVITPTLEV
jgi:hypothetical protein